VEEVNRDPRRGIGHEKVLTRLVFDHQADTMLARNGYTRETVPEAGERVFLRSTGNLSTGGTATDMTDIVHPDNAEMAVRAVKAIGLDVGGVDFLMDMLFPPGTPSRIPIAAVTGTNGKTTTARMLAHINKLAGHHVGLTTTDGVYIDGQRTVSGDMTGPVATRMVLSDPSVDVAVLEVARGGLLRAGMGVRHCDVGAVLNVKADHLGLRGIGTLEELAQVKRIVVEVARDTAVLNADDPLCLKMADYTEAKHLCYVTMDPTHELVGEHIKAGGRGVVLESGIKGQMITIYDHNAHIPLLWTHLIPATLEGRAMHNVQNAMFAAAMAFSMGLKLEDVRHGLRTFDTTFFQAPGRMNIFDEHPFKVILDYGHNPHAISAMCDLVERLEPAGRRIVVLAAPGDRRDEDIADIARTAAGRFDRYIVRRDDQLRGRQPEEVPHLLRDVLLGHGVPAEQILVIPDEQAAIDRALREAQAGDLVLLFADAITRSWKQVIQFRPEAPVRTVERRKQPRPEPALVGEPAATAPLVDEGRREFVRDVRGVRLARESDD
jgi:cyanophycin synthetase